MLTKDQIKKALHADRAVPLNIANPHGPLGLEQLAEAVARLRQPASATTARQVTLPAETWRRLDQLAREASEAQPQPVSASDLAAAILEQAVTSH
jgi:hypothetical protein